MEVKVCHVCECEYEASESPYNKVCSQECWIEHRTMCGFAPIPVTPIKPISIRRFMTEDDERSLEGSCIGHQDI